MRVAFFTLNSDAFFSVFLYSWEHGSDKDFYNSMLLSNYTPKIGNETPGPALSILWGSGR